MNSHLTDKQLNAYIHQALRDDEREAMDRHLAACATCRGRRDDRAALQRRVHYGLLAEINAIRPSPAMTFANLAPRLQPPSRREVFLHRSRRLFSGAAALAALAVLALILIGLMSSSQHTASPDATPAVTPSTTEPTSNLSRPAPLPNDPRGWSPYSDTPQNYEFGLDYGMAHSGSASGFIKSKVASPSGSGVLAQTISARQYAGRRVRLSGYVKADRVEGWAGLYLRVDGPQFQMLAFDNMQNRPIQGSRDWQAYEVVLDVPENSADLAMGLLLEGAGEVWVDDVQLEVVGTDVPTTAASSLPLLGQPQNVDFEAGASLPGWFRQGTEEYEIDVDPALAHSGSASLRIQSKDSATGDSIGVAGQTIAADKYLGGRVRLSGYVKTDQVGGSAGLWMRTDGPQNQVLSHDDMQDRSIRGSTDWQRYDIVLDVPSNAVDIVFGGRLQGQGQVWLDDLQLDVVGPDVATTGSSPTATSGQIISAPMTSVVKSQPVNLDFEAGIDDWSAADGNAQSYASRLDPTFAHSGLASGSVRSLSDQPIGVGALVQNARLDAYRDQRIRLSAYIKTELSYGTAYLITHIYGNAGQTLYANAQSIEGTTDWQKIEIVLNVPVNGEWLKYGLALTGAGIAWIDDVQIEVVGQDVPTSSFDTSPLQYTGYYVPPPTAGDLDFEDNTLSGSWRLGSSASYTVDLDRSVAHTGSASGHIQSQGTPPDGDFGSLGQAILADNYRGKRVRLSAYVKANQIEGWAGLWMAVRDSNNQAIRFDNMQSRPIQGTRDWQKYEIVLDVPDNSLGIAFGFLLVGQGEGWVDDMQLEAVGQDVPTTDYYNYLPQQPVNLDFEQ